MTRLDPREEPAYRGQDISEVWFTGCHGDIGGGDLALRWMLGEAVHVRPGLLLADSGVSLLARSDPTGLPAIHQSWTWPWRAIEQVPRLEIDNSGVYPVKVRHRGSDGVRDPAISLRQGRVVVHASVGDRDTIQGRVEGCETKGLPATTT